MSQVLKGFTAVNDTSPSVDSQMKGMKRYIPETSSYVQLFDVMVDRSSKSFPDNILLIEQRQLPLLG